MDEKQIYMPIPISEFVAGVVVPVDLHIRLSEDKFVCVAKAQTQSNVEQFRNYQNREVLYLWVRKKEYYKIAHQVIRIAELAVSKRDLDDKQKTLVLSYAARSVFRQIESIGIDMEVYNNAKQITEAVIGLVETHHVLSDMFQSLRTISDQVIAHAVAVSTLSTLIGQKMGFQKRSTLEKLALGGLLHDIGLKAIPKEIAEKPLAIMTPEEVAIYETHSFRGMQMLQSLGIVPDDLVSIVYEHHENAIGQGFPQRLREVKMHPLARVVALANGYANLIFPNVNCPTPKNPREALMYIEHTLGIPYSREAFRALKRVIDGDSAKAA